MLFYVSWYPGDPVYSVYDENCAFLVSVTSVARNWTVNQLPRRPRRLLIDSGGYRFATYPSEALPPATILRRQLEILSGCTSPSIICARDHPILRAGADQREKDSCITQTIAFAYELKSLIERTGLPDNVQPMAIVQGYDRDSLQYCAQELKAIGFPLFGIGSLAGIRHHNVLMERVNAVAAIIPPANLHLLGFSSVPLVRQLAKRGFSSFDSARPAKAAMYNEVLYSRPYRRYGIEEPDNALVKQRLPPGRRLSIPLPCKCPVCRRNPEKILQVGSRDAIRDRALHNYFHLKREFALSAAENEMIEP